MTNEEAKVFLDNLKICINEHPVVADWLVEIADRKTEPFAKDTNVRSKDCETCKHYKLACELFSEVCKYEPITKTETQNSNLTFEKRTMRDCYNCKRYETEEECIECHYEPNDEPQTDCPWK